MHQHDPELQRQSLRIGPSPLRVGPAPGGAPTGGLSCVFPRTLRGHFFSPAVRPTWSAEGNQEDAQFGQSVAPAGDVNGDGFADVLVGAPYYDNRQTNGGRAFLYLGSAAGLSTIPSKRRG